MGKNRGNGGVVSFRRFGAPGMGKSIPYNPLKPPTQPLVEGIVPTARAFFDDMLDEDEWKGEIVTTVNTEKYECRKCHEKQIPKALIIVKGDQLQHVVKSSVPGGGTRFCGPCQKEVAP